MIRSFLCLLGALWLTSCGALGGQDWGEPSPALWEANGPDGEQLWLFGTIHALPDGVTWRTETLDTAIARSDVLLVEIANLDTPQLQATFEQLSRTPGQPPLPSRVDAQDRANLRQLMRSARADTGDFADVETWAAALMLASAVRESDPANGVDRALTDAAQRVVGLETIVGQLGIFDQLSQADQADFLALTARSSVANEGETAGRAWHKGDLAVLDRLVGEPLQAYPALYSALLSNRNRSWMDTIAQELEDGHKPFVAVGAAHMLGPDGLPALLEAEGYTLRRLQ